MSRGKETRLPREREMRLSKSNPPFLLSEGKSFSMQTIFSSLSIADLPLDSLRINTMQDGQSSLGKAGMQ